jgi:hypothetical protein
MKHKTVREINDYLAAAGQQNENDFSAFWANPGPGDTVIVGDNEYSVFGKPVAIKNAVAQIKPGASHGEVWDALRKFDDFCDCKNFGVCATCETIYDSTAALIATAGLYELRHSDGSQDWPGFSLGGMKRGYWWGNDIYREFISTCFEEAKKEVLAQCHWMGLEPKFYREEK